MRLVVARCTVDYRGRLDAHLPEAVREVDGAVGFVGLHSDIVEALQQRPQAGLAGPQCRLGLLLFGDVADMK